MSEDLVLLPQLNAVAVFGTENGSAHILDEIRKKVEGVFIDVSTSKGRDDLRSFAFRIAKTKTLLDDEGKKLKEEHQKIVNLVDGERKKIRDELDALKDKVRAPLTEYENREKLRVEERENRIAEIQALANIALPVAEKSEKLSSLREYDWQEFAFRAAEAVKSAEDAIAQDVKREEERAELERFRAEQAKREQEERERRIAEDARKESEARAAEAEKRAAQAEADMKAAEERKAQEIEAAQKEAALSELRKIAAEKKRLADEEEARMKDKAHKGKINREILAALVETGVSEEVAKTVIVAIATGKIPHTKISY